MASSVEMPATDLTNAVEMRNLSMVFQRRRGEPLVAVDDLNLTIAQGQVFGLLGPNGSGKTTTVNMLSGLLRPTSGRIVCEGIDVQENVTGVRERLGVVPQETALYNDLTGLENLVFHARLYKVPRAERGRRIAEVLDLVGLTSRQHDRTGTYSGGMQRRLALARALLTHPDVVVLDEPTLGVDVQSRAAIWERIRQIADSGKTVLLTTNYMEEAQALADQLAILDHGRLVAQGTSASLRAGLGRSYIELEAELGAVARTALEEISGIQSVSWQGDHAQMVSPDAAATIVQVLAFLNERGIRVRHIGMREPDLNDVFLSLTGRALRD